MKFATQISPLLNSNFSGAQHADVHAPVLEAHLPDLQFLREQDRCRVDQAHRSVTSEIQILERWEGWSGTCPKCPCFKCFNCRKRGTGKNWLTTLWSPFHQTFHEANYSNHLNTGPIWYSNGRFVSGCQMVWYSNVGLKTGLKKACSWLNLNPNLL